MQWTKEQMNVIKADGTNLLVAAGAGSGKTAVLVERIIQKLLDKQAHLSIDRLLVVTFTNAAANQMKQRIIRAIEDRLGEEPDNEWLKSQLTLVNSAMITTIDSFCRYVYMNYFNDIGADPSLKIADEVEADMIKFDVLKEVIEEAYSQGDEDFLSFAKNYSGSKRTDEFSEDIYELHKKASAMVDPYRWIAELPLIYEDKSMHSSKDQDHSLPDIDELVLKHCISMAGNAKELAQMLLIWLTDNGNGDLKYIDNVNSDIELIDRICNASDIIQLRERVNEKFSRLATVRGVDEDVKTLIKEVRESYKHIIETIRNGYFAYSEKTYEELRKAEYRNVTVLSKLTLEFMKRYDKRKLDAGLMDFSDLSHYVLDIVWDKEKECQKNAAREMASFYSEIMIDEYQDSNDVQEKILTAVSGMYDGRNNIFMVGDVKQSIYKFRMAKPELFNEKYNTYAPYDVGVIRNGQECVKGRVIDLHENFRSADHCIDLVNEIFKKIMRKEVGGIDYDERAALVFGARILKETDAAGIPFDKDKLRCEIDICLGDQDMIYDKAQAEAQMISARIKRLMEEDIYISETGGGKLVRRKLKYGDIVILLRKLKGYSDVFADVFEKNGIPYEAENSTGYFDTIEIRTLFDALNVINNPYQDIALAGVLCSSFAGFQASELAQLRAAYPDCHLYDGIIKYIAYCERSGDADGSEDNRGLAADEAMLRKCVDFVAFLDKYRKISNYKPIGELISDLVTETGYYDHVCTLGNGEKRRANIDALINKALGLSEKNSKSLHSFIAVIEKMRKYEKSFEPPALVSENDAVRIMTIHKSKGLEFPVVFVSGCTNNFNLMDTRDRLLIDTRLGISLQNRDYDKRLKYNDRVRKMMADNILCESIGEELRILYVALTRAKEKLIITGCEIMGARFDTKDYLEPDLGDSTRKLSVAEILKCRRYIDLIIKALMPQHSDMVSFIMAKDIDESVLESEKERISDYLDLKRIREATADVRGKYYDLLKAQRDYEYPYMEAVNTRAKSSVSQIKHEYMKDEEYAGYMKPDMAYETEQDISDHKETEMMPEPAPVPDFVSLNNTKISDDAGSGIDGEHPEALRVSASERGTLYHSIMEHLDLDTQPDISCIREQTEKMCQNGFLPEGYVEAVDLKKIERFVSSKTGKQACKAFRSGRLYREKQFYINLEDEVSKEPVVVQGVIDAYWIEDDGIVLLDYKTDRVRASDAQRVFKDRYEKQLEIYAEALQRVSGQKVKKRIIYSFELDRAYEV